MWHAHGWAYVTAAWQAACGLLLLQHGMHMSGKCLLTVATALVACTAYVPPTWSCMLLQAISVIVTHRTDDMSKLPPRLPVNAPQPRSKPALTKRPKLRLNPTAQAEEAAPIETASVPSSGGVDVVMGEEGVLLERTGEMLGSATAAEAAADGAASPAAINAGESLLPVCTAGSADTRYSDEAKFLDTISCSLCIAEHLLPVIDPSKYMCMLLLLLLLLM